MAPNNMIPTIEITEVPIPKKNVSESNFDTIFEFFKRKLEEFTIVRE